ncbi:MAG: hypothetical protein K2N37_04690, partial [Lachnospiraceae bacterium]|nr:hypothetical protein [Lachnospiraceae bacterium]
MKRKWQSRWKSRSAGLLRVVFVAACALMLSACGSKEEEIPMGRYADREVEMPTGTFNYVHPCPDGSFYLYGTEANLTYVDAEGAS